MSVLKNIQYLVKAIRNSRENGQTRFYLWTVVVKVTKRFKCFASDPWGRGRSAPVDDLDAMCQVLHHGYLDD